MNVIKYNSIIFYHINIKPFFNLMELLPFFLSFAISMLFLVMLDSSWKVMIAVAFIMGFGIHDLYGWKNRIKK